MDTPAAAATQQPRLLELVRAKIRYITLQHSHRACICGLGAPVHPVHGKQHPSSMGKEEVEVFLTHLAMVGNVAASTQNQAKSALLFLYREVLGIELPWLDDVQSAKRSQRLPVVLTEDETAALLDRMSGTSGLIARLLYGRVCACSKQRVCASRIWTSIAARPDRARGRGTRTAGPCFPGPLAPSLTSHLVRVQGFPRRGPADRVRRVYLPHALDRKFPTAAAEWTAGNTYSPRLGCHGTPARAKRAGIISMRPRSSTRDRRGRYGETRITKPATPATLPTLASPPTCSRLDTTSGRCRSC